MVRPSVRWILQTLLVFWILCSSAHAFFQFEDFFPTRSLGNASDADLLTNVPLFYFPPGQEDGQGLYELSGAFSHSLTGPWFDPNVPAAREGQPSALHVTADWMKDAPIRWRDMIEDIIRDLENEPLPGMDCDGVGFMEHDQEDYEDDDDFDDDFEDFSTYPMEEYIIDPDGTCDSDQHCVVFPGEGEPPVIHGCSDSCSIDTSAGDVSIDLDTLDIKFQDGSGIQVHATGRVVMTRIHLYVKKCKRRIICFCSRVCDDYVVGASGIQLDVSVPITIDDDGTPVMTPKAEVELPDFDMNGCKPRGFLAKFLKFWGVDFKKKIQETAQAAIKKKIEEWTDEFRAQQDVLLVENIYAKYALTEITTSEGSGLNAKADAMILAQVYDVANARWVNLTRPVAPQAPQEPTAKPDPGYYLLGAAGVGLDVFSAVLWANNITGYSQIHKVVKVSDAILDVIFNHTTPELSCEERDLVTWQIDWGLVSVQCKTEDIPAYDEFLLMASIREVTGNGTVAYTNDTDPGLQFTLDHVNPTDNATIAWPKIPFPPDVTNKIVNNFFEEIPKRSRSASENNILRFPKLAAKMIVNPVLNVEPVVGEDPSPHVLLHSACWCGEEDPRGRWGPCEFDCDPAPEPVPEPDPEDPEPDPEDPEPDPEDPEPDPEDPEPDPEDPEPDPEDGFLSGSEDNEIVSVFSRLLARSSRRHNAQSGTLLWGSEDDEDEEDHGKTFGDRTGNFHRPSQVSKISEKSKNITLDDLPAVHILTHTAPDCILRAGMVVQTLTIEPIPAPNCTLLPATGHYHTYDPESGLKLGCRTSACDDCSVHSTDPPNDRESLQECSGMGSKGFAVQVFPAPWSELRFPRSTVPILSQFNNDSSHCAEMTAPPLAYNGIYTNCDEIVQEGTTGWLHDARSRQLMGDCSDCLTCNRLYRQFDMDSCYTVGDEESIFTVLYVSDAFDPPKIPGEPWNPTPLITGIVIVLVLLPFIAFWRWGREPAWRFFLRAREWRPPTIPFKRSLKELSFTDRVTMVLILAVFVSLLTLCIMSWANNPFDAFHNELLTKFNSTDNQKLIINGTMPRSNRTSVLEDSGARAIASRWTDLVNLGITLMTLSSFFLFVGPAIRHSHSKAKRLAQRISIGSCVFMILLLLCVLFGSFYFEEFRTSVWLTTGNLGDFQETGSQAVGYGLAAVAFGWLSIILLQLSMAPALSLTVGIILFFYVHHRKQLILQEALAAGIEPFEGFDSDPKISKNPKIKNDGGSYVPPSQFPGEEQKIQTSEKTSSSEESKCSDDFAHGGEGGGDPAPELDMVALEFRASLPKQKSLLWLMDELTSLICSLSTTITGVCVIASLIPAIIFYHFAECDASFLVMYFGAPLVSSWLLQRITNLKRNTIRGFLRPLGMVFLIQMLGLGVTQWRLAVGLGILQMNRGWPITLFVCFFILGVWAIFQTLELSEYAIWELEDAMVGPNRIDEDVEDELSEGEEGEKVVETTAREPTAPPQAMSLNTASSEAVVSFTSTNHGRMLDLDEPFAHSPGAPEGAGEGPVVVPEDSKPSASALEDQEEEFESENESSPGCCRSVWHFLVEKHEQEEGVTKYGRRSVYRRLFLMIVVLLKVMMWSLDEDELNVTPQQFFQKQLENFRIDMQWPEDDEGGTAFNETIALFYNVHKTGHMLSLVALLFLALSVGMDVIVCSRREKIQAPRVRLFLSRVFNVLALILEFGAILMISLPDYVATTHYADLCPECGENFYQLYLALGYSLASAGTALLVTVQVAQLVIVASQLQFRALLFTWAQPESSLSVRIRSRTRVSLFAQSVFVAALCPLVTITPLSLLSQLAPNVFPSICLFLATILPPITTGLLWIRYRPVQTPRQRKSFRFLYTFFLLPVLWGPILAALVWQMIHYSAIRERVVDSLKDPELAASTMAEILFSLVVLSDIIFSVTFGTVNYRPPDCPETRAIGFPQASDDQEDLRNSDSAALLEKPLSSEGHGEVEETVSSPALRALLDPKLRNHLVSRKQAAGPEGFTYDYHYDFELRHILSQAEWDQMQVEKARFEKRYYFCCRDRVDEWTK